MSTHIERAFGGRWLDDLWTFAVSVRYDFNSRTGHLHMPADCCCDAHGCVNFFRRIDPKVRAIHTYAGDAPDTSYRRIKHEWASFTNGDKVGQGPVPPCTDSGKANAALVRAFLHGI